MRNLILWGVLLINAIALTGCGGSGSSTQNGRAAFTVRWPDRSRLIPDASNSIQVTVRQGTAQVAAQLLPRPQQGGTSVATFDPLPVGDLTVTATAFPQTDGTGVAQATATIPLAIQSGQTTNFTLTMLSTVDTLELAANPSQILRGTVSQMTATAKNAAGEIVLTAPSKMQWRSSNVAVATVDDTGKVTGVSAGNADITVTETESGKSATQNIVVNLVAPITFTAPVQYPVADTPEPSLEVGDVDGDGNVDMLIGTNVNARIRYGRGDGTVGAEQVLLTWTGGAYPIAPADMNGDGRLDVVCRTSNQVIILHNQGNRTFAPPSAVPAGATIGNIATGDFTGDRRPDIVYVTDGGSSSTNIHILRNMGNGTYNQVSSNRELWIILGYRVGDINGDGNLDLAVAITTSIGGRSGVAVYWGDGAGQITRGPEFGVGSFNANWPLIADLNGDGRRDLGITIPTDGVVSFIFNQGNQTFNTPQSYHGSDTPNHFFAADFDGDGALDPVTENRNNIAIFRNENGLFPVATQISVGVNAGHMAVADFNKDGKPDLATAIFNGVCILLNTTQ